MVAIPSHIRTADDLFGQGATTGSITDSLRKARALLPSSARLLSDFGADAAGTLANLVLLKSQVQLLCELARSMTQTKSCKV